MKGGGEPQGVTLVRPPRRCKPEFGAPELVMVYREKNAEKENKVGTPART